MYTISATPWDYEAILTPESVKVIMKHFLSGKYAQQANPAELLHSRLISPFGGDKTKILFPPNARGCGL
jgi:hypothetical protein